MSTQSRFRKYTEKMQNISTCHELSEVLADSERSLYFYLMDSYFSNRDLSFIKKDITNDVAVAISLFCMVAKARGGEDDLKIYDYLSKYVYVEESPIQADKVLGDLAIQRAREKFLEENNFKIEDEKLVKRD